MLETLRSQSSVMHSKRTHLTPELLQLHT